MRSETRRGQTFVLLEEGERVGAAGEQEAVVELGNVGRAMAQLPPEQREAVALVVVEGFAYKEAAAILDVPIGTLTSRLVRGREALMAKLERRHDDRARDADGLCRWRGRSAHRQARRARDGGGPGAGGGGRAPPRADGTTARCVHGGGCGAMPGGVEAMLRQAATVVPLPTPVRPAATRRWIPAIAAALVAGLALGQFVPREEGDLVSRDGVTVAAGALAMRWGHSSQRRRGATRRCGSA
ncbi:sigma factor-like helix-turn-helix DNA-binding protein [Sphingomonas sp. MMS24-JH45]